MACSPQINDGCPPQQEWSMFGCQPCLSNNVPGTGLPDENNDKDKKPVWETVLTHLPGVLSGVGGLLGKGNGGGGNNGQQPSQPNFEYPDPKDDNKSKGDLTKDDKRIIVGGVVIVVVGVILYFVLRTPKSSKN